jgi:hypothetical protein
MVPSHASRLEPNLASLAGNQTIGLQRVRISTFGVQPATTVTSPQADPVTLKTREDLPRSSSPPLAFARRRLEPG